MTSALKGRGIVHHQRIVLVRVMVTRRRGRKYPIIFQMSYILDGPWSESGTVVNPILNWSTVSPGPPRDGGGRSARRRKKVFFFCKSIDISREG